MSALATGSAMLVAVLAGIVAAMLAFAAMTRRMRGRLQDLQRRVVDAESRARALMQGSGDAIVVLDPQMRVVDWNLGAERLFGFARTEVIGQDGIELMVPEASRAFVRGMLDRFAGGSRYTHTGDRVAITLATSAGEPLPVELRMSHFRAAGEVSYSMHLRDLRGERDAAAALRSNERRYRAVLNGLRDIVFQTDLAGVITFLNRPWRQLTHFSLEESLGRSIFDFVQPADHEQLAHFLEHTGTDSGSAATIELRLRQNTHDVRVMMLSAQPLRDADGELLGLVGTIEDITERRAVELRLRDQLRFNRDLLEAVPVPVSVRNLAGEYVAVNRAWERFAGVERKHVLGRTLRDMFPGVVSDDLDRSDREIIATGGTWTEHRLLRGMDGVHRRALYCRSAFVHADGSDGGVISAFLGTGEYMPRTAVEATAAPTDSDANGEPSTLPRDAYFEGVTLSVEQPAHALHDPLFAPAQAPAELAVDAPPSPEREPVHRAPRAAAGVARGLHATLP